MTVQVINRLRDAAVPLAWLTRLARKAAQRLKIRGRGAFVVACIDQRTMRALNRRFLRHAGLTDVLSFNYLTGKPASAAPVGGVIGEVLVSPAFAKRYAKAHGLAYRDELARYVVHGLLHWAGHDDATPAQQRRMRVLEDRMLRTCRN